MKKIIAIVLVVVVAAVAVFALTSNKAPEASATPYEGTLEDLTNALYEANPVEFMVGPAMPVVASATSQSPFLSSPAAI